MIEKPLKALIGVFIGACLFFLICVLFSSCSSVSDFVPEEHKELVQSNVVMQKVLKETASIYRLSESLKEKYFAHFIFNAKTPGDATIVITTSPIEKLAEGEKVADKVQIIQVIPMILKVAPNSDVITLHVKLEEDDRYLQIDRDLNVLMVQGPVMHHMGTLIEVGVQ
jgi:hypothetical protein